MSEQSKATRRRVLQATAGALAAGTVSGRGAAQEVNGSDNDSVSGNRTDSPEDGAAQEASGPTVYVGSGSNLYAVDAATGVDEWAFETGDQVFSSPTVVDGTVYVGSDSLYAVDAGTGEQQWAFETGDSGYSQTVVDGTVYVGSDSLDAVDARTGEQEWAFDTAGVPSSPTVVDGTVYVESSNDLYAVDAATGEQEWAFDPGDDVEMPPTVVDDPKSGNSVGSRVMLGTLGHHGDWRYAEQSIDIQQWGAQTHELFGLGATGLVTLFGVRELLNPRRLDSQDDRNLSATEKLRHHSGMTLAVAGLLLSISSLRRWSSSVGL